MSIAEYLEVESDIFRDISNSRGRRTLVGGYVSISDYVLKNGHLFESAPLTPGEKSYVRLLGMEKCKLKACYRNAQRTFLFHPGVHGMVLKYIEGYATIGFLPVQHAWLSLNGKVVDLTWGPMDKRGHRKGRVLGVIPPGFEYYGLAIERREVSDFVLAHETWGPIIDDYECGFPMLRGNGRHGKSSRRAVRSGARE